MTISELFKFVAASSISEEDMSELRESTLKAEEAAEASFARRIATTSDMARTYSL